MPVAGPKRWTLIITHGTSAITAKPRFSCIREKPGPLVAVNAFSPARLAPITAAILAISSSICIYIPPWPGSTAEHISAISVEGHIGYPAKNLAPATTAARTQASFPWRNLRLIELMTGSPQLPGQNPGSGKSRAGNWCSGQAL